MRNKIITFTLTGMITILVFLVTLLVLPDIEKYNAEIVSEKKFTFPEIPVFYDLNGDEISEKIRVFKNFEGNGAIIVEQQNKLLYQHNFEGKFNSKNFFHFSDYNNDSIVEISVITHKNDSIFLSIVEGITDNTIIENIFVSLFYYHESNPDYSVNSFQNKDFNGDGYKDMYFSLHCTFSYKTRKSVLYDIAHDKITQTPPVGVHFSENIHFYDINDNGTPEIFGDMRALGNSPENYPLSDQFMYFYVLNANLKQLFSPIMTGHYPGIVKTRPLVNGSNKNIVIFSHHRGNKNDSTFLGIYNSNGKLIRKKIIPFKKSLHEAVFLTFPENNPHKIMLIHSNGIGEIYNDELKKIDEKKILPFHKYLFSYDMDNDGKKEHFFQENNSNIFFTRSDFSFPVHLNISAGNIYPSVEKNELDNFFHLVVDNVHYKIDFHKNKRYDLRYLIYAGLAITLFFLIHFTGKAYQKIVQNHFISEKKLARLQIAGLEKQLSPHFNLNILNSIGSLYETQQTETARYYLGKYGILLRNLLVQSGNIAVTVKNELDFTKNYLELEKLRLNNPFNYKITGEKECSDREIPKMLIQTFCENAVKHGLKHLTKKGQLNIKFIKDNNQLKIIISDNGIGREKAMQYSLMSTGKGLEILNQTLELYNKLKNIDIQYKIFDIYNTENQSSGTKVEITIPDNSKPSKFRKL